MVIELVSNPINLLQNLDIMESEGLGRKATKEEYKQIYDYLYTYELKRKDVSGDVAHFCWNDKYDGKSNLLMFFGNLNFKGDSFFKQSENRLSHSLSEDVRDSKNPKYRSVTGLSPERIVNGLIGVHSLNRPPFSDHTFYYNLDDGLHLNGTYGVKSTNLFRNSAPLITGVSQKTNEVLPLYSNQVITSTVFKYYIKDNTTYLSSDYKKLCSVCPSLENYDFVVIVQGVLLSDVYNIFRNKCPIKVHEGKQKCQLHDGLYSTLVPLDYYVSNLLYQSNSPIHLINGNNNQDFLCFLSVQLGGFLRTLHQNPININDEIRSIFRESTVDGKNPIVSSYYFVQKSYQTRVKSLPTEETTIRLLFPDATKFHFIDFLCTYKPILVENGSFTYDFTVQYNGVIDFSSIMSSYHPSVDKTMGFIKQHKLNKYAICGLGFAGCLKKMQNDMRFKPSDLLTNEITIVYSDILELFYNYDDGSFSELVDIWSKDNSSDSPLACDINFNCLINCLKPLIYKSFPRETHIDDYFVNNKIKELQHDFEVIGKNMYDYHMGLERGILNTNDDKYKYYCTNAALFTWFVCNRMLNIPKSTFEKELSRYLPSVILSPVGLIDYSNLLSAYSKKGGSLFQLSIYPEYKEYIKKTENLVHKYLQELPPNLISTNVKRDKLLMTDCGGRANLKEYLETDTIREIFKEEREKLESKRARYEYYKDIGIIQDNQNSNSSASSTITSTIQLEQRPLGEILQEEMDKLKSNNSDHSNIFDSAENSKTLNIVDDINISEFFNTDTKEKDKEIYNISNENENMQRDIKDKHIEKEKICPIDENSSVEEKPEEKPEEKSEELSSELNIQDIDLNADSFCNCETCEYKKRIINMESYKLQIIRLCHKHGKEVILDAINMSLFTEQEYIDFLSTSLESFGKTNFDFILAVGDFIKKY